MRTKACLGGRCGVGGDSERHEGINRTKGRPRSLCRRRTPVEWSSIFAFWLLLWKCKSKDRKKKCKAGQNGGMFSGFLKAPLRNFLSTSEERGTAARRNVQISTRGRILKSTFLHYWILKQHFFTSANSTRLILQENDSNKAVTMTYLIWVHVLEQERENSKLKEIRCLELLFCVWRFLPYVFSFSAELQKNIIHL